MRYKLATLRRPDPRQPIMNRGWFVVVFGVYAAFLQLLVVSSTLSPRENPELGASYFCVCALVFTALGFLGRRELSTDQFFDPPAITAAIVLFAFLGLPAAFLALSDASAESIFQLGLVASVEGTLLSLIFAKSFDRVLPEKHQYFSRIDDKIAYLELNMTNFYRFSQITGTFFVVFGVGITAALLREGSQFDTSGIALHALASAVGVLYLILYILWKINAIRDEIATLYMARSRDWT